MLAALVLSVLAAGDAPLAEWNVHQATECVLVDQNKVGVGCWIDEPSCIGIDKERRRLSAENASLKASLSDSVPSWIWVAAAAVVGAGGGVAIGYLAWGRPTPSQ